jgi:hypothetical protein
MQVIDVHIGYKNGNQSVFVRQVAVPSVVRIGKRIGDFVEVAPGRILEPLDVIGNSGGSA